VPQSAHPNRSRWFVWLIAFLGLVIPAAVVARAVAMDRSAKPARASHLHRARHGCPSRAARRRAHQQVLFGDQAIEPRRARTAGGVAQAFPFRSSKSGAARAVCVYVARGSHSKRVVVGIYTSSHGRPGRLLKTGVLSSPRSGAWNLVHVASTRVTARRHYWVAVLAQRGGIAVREKDSRTCRGVKARRHGMHALPSAWTKSARWAGCPMSAYIVGVRAAHGAKGANPPAPPASAPPPANVIPQNCSTTFTPSTWSASAVKAAGSGGQTLCLSTGSYSDIELVGYHPSRNVSIEPVTGQSIALGRVTLTGVSNLSITGFGPPNGSSSSDGMLAQGEYSGPNYDIVFSYNAMSSDGVDITQNAMSNANIQITHNRFVGFGSAGESDRLDIDTRSASNCPNGVVVSYNLISGGQSDGIDLTDGTCGTQILHNEISGINQGNCGGIHCDAIQDDGGGMRTVISGNYFHGNSDGILQDDGNTGPDIITNNVFDNPTYRCIEGMYGDGSIFAHNTFDCEVNIGVDHNGEPTTNVTMTNNVFGPSKNAQLSYAPSASSFGSFKTLDYNLHASGAYSGPGNGPHDIIGSPTYVGGSEPSTYAGWALSARPVDVGKASDGTNMGAPITSVGP
jgi:hypothetical protein